ncbi:MAG: ubiquinone/menaquinone biosynthesis methyltransferase [bacterium]|nr:ubiquinone/menaquinone biosynthesis methyltransferase [bacterium]
MNALPAPGEKREFVRRMFDRIAPRYDLVNRLMTLGQDQRWRREAVSSAGVRSGTRVLDLASGTGDLAELCRSRGASVLAMDLSQGMLRAARERCQSGLYVQADGAALPVSDACIDVVTCGFALRNFDRLEETLAECARVLVPGGRLVVLEVDEPRSALMRWGHNLHFKRLVPMIGALISDAEAYRYLPASTSYLPSEPEIRALLAHVGFPSVEKRVKLFGSAQILFAKRA